MLERLFKNKKFLFTYFLSFLGAFSNFSAICPSASCALFASNVEAKIPALIPVLFTTVVQGILFGKVAVIRYIAFVILYSISKVKFKTKKDLNLNDYDYLKYFIPRVLIISCIIEVILLLTKVTLISEIAYIFAHIILTAGFSFVFERGFRYISSISNNKEEKITVINTISFVFMAVCITSCLSELYIINTNIWILVAVCLLMIYAWKNYVSRALICSMIVFLATAIIIGYNPLNLVLLAVCGIVTALLSKAGKKGAIIGIVISLLYIFVSQSQYSAIDDLTMNKEIQDDYLKFVQKESNIQEDNPLQSTAELEEIVDDAKKSNSMTMLKSMLVGFILLLAIPEKYLEKLKIKIDKKDGFTIFKEKIYGKFIVYKLNPGSIPEEENDKKPTNVKNTKSKKKKSKA